VVEHEIVPNGDGFSVRIYDAPAGGWRILFGEKEGAIGTYTKYDDAKAGVRVYDRSDKTVLFEAEFEVYLRSARTGQSSLKIIGYKGGEPLYSEGWGASQ